MVPDPLYGAATTICLGCFLFALQQLGARRGPSEETNEQEQPDGLAASRVWLRGMGLLALGGIAVSIVGAGMSPAPRELRVAVQLCIAAMLVLLAVGMLSRRAVKPRAVEMVAWSSRRRRSLRMVVIAGPMSLGVATGWTLAPSNELPSALAPYPPKPFYVYGTCLNGACELNRRTEPKLDAPTRGRRLDDGERVMVLCQRYGGLVRARLRRRSTRWDLLADGTWVSDLFITTSKQGPTSRDLPRCPPHLPS